MCKCGGVPFLDRRLDSFGYLSTYFFTGEYPSQNLITKKIDRTHGQRFLFVTVLKRLGCSAIKSSHSVVEFVVGGLKSREPTANALNLSYKVLHLVSYLDMPTDRLYLSVAVASIIASSVDRGWHSIATIAHIVADL